jgi:hypothetical protein
VRGKHIVMIHGLRGRESESPPMQGELSAKASSPGWSWKVHSLAVGTKENPQATICRRC